MFDDTFKKAICINEQKRIRVLNLKLLKKVFKVLHYRISDKHTDFFSSIDNQALWTGDQIGRIFRPLGYYLFWVGSCLEITEVVHIFWLPSFTVEVMN
jgi:hypothetical protein